MDCRNSIAIRTGAIYLIMITNNFSRLNGPFNFTSSEMTEGFTTNPIKIHVKNATIGIRILLLIKSKKSRNCIPITVTALHML